MTEFHYESLRIGSVVKGRYCVVRQLKVGGMGAVYEVTDQVVGKRRALKVMLPHLVTAAMRERFQQEASIPGAIDSENVVDVTDQGVDDESGLPFLVMELLKGEDLQARVRRGRLTAAEAVQHLHRASLALDRAHAADIVHRDLKPENLFVTRSDEGREGLKVLDFGIAKVVAESTQHSTTQTIGTPLYMAPEQIHGEDAISPASDTYALGLVAFTLLTGHAFWEPEASRLGQLPFLSLIARGPQEPASARASVWGVQLPGAFDAWFSRATAAAPGERFESASELVDELASAFGTPHPQQPSGGLLDLSATLSDSASIGLAPTLLDGAPGGSDSRLVRHARTSSAGALSSGAGAHAPVKAPRQAIAWGLGVGAVVSLAFAAHRARVQIAEPSATPQAVALPQPTASVAAIAPVQGAASPTLPAATSAAAVVASGVLSSRPASPAPRVKSPPLPAKALPPVQVPPAAAPSSYNPMEHL